MNTALALARMDHALLRPALGRVLPPDLFIKLYSKTRSSFLKHLAGAFEGEQQQAADYYPTTLFKNGLVFRNDLGNAAGFDKDGSLLEFNYRLGAGFAVVGTVLDRPFAGNRIPVLGGSANPWTPLHFSASAINSLGLPSRGVSEAVENVRTFRKKHSPENFPIGMSIMGHPEDGEEEKVHGIASCVESALEVVDFIEINESCPNTTHDESEQMMCRRIQRVVQLRDRADRYVPVLVKLGDLGAVDYTVSYLSDLGVDGIVGLNTQKDYSHLETKIDRRELPLFRHYTGTYAGGVSGAAIRDRAFAQIQAAADAIQRSGSSMLLVHVGGIFSPRDIQDSRAINAVCGGQNVVGLREWYTGLMYALGAKDPLGVYKRMTGAGYCQ